LAHLDVAFAHLTERFKHRISVRVLDDINRIDGVLDDAIEETRSATIEVPPARASLIRQASEIIFEGSGGGAADHVESPLPELTCSPSSASLPVRQPSARVRPLALSIAHIWRHHKENGLLVLYAVPKVRRYLDDQQHDHKVDW
jgi:hypothetical protein